MGTRQRRTAAHDHGTTGGHDGHTRLVDAHDLFERTLIGLCREHKLGDRLSPDDIADVVDTMVEAFPDTVAELAGLVERREWDEILALAARERTLAELRRGR